MDLGDIYRFSKDLGKIDFVKLVHESAGHDMIRYDPTDEIHKTVLDKMSDALNTFVKSSRRATRFTGNRVNDIGSTLEETIMQEMKKVGLDSKKLSGSGYPDLMITHCELDVYVEMKSSSVKNGNVNHRLFYYTSGKKITVDAIHLLLQIALTEEKDKIWIVDNWTLRDLYDLKVGLKAEFNANQRDFDSLGSIASGLR